MSELHDAIYQALWGYRCQYAVDDDEDGCTGLDLVDVLSPGPTIIDAQREIGLLTDAIADAVDAAGRPTIPSPSECRDPERLRRIRPETVERWLRGRGWAEVYKDQRCPLHRDGAGVSWLYWGENPSITRDYLRRMADVHDIWPHQVLAELEAMQAEKD